MSKWLKSVNNLLEHLDGQVETAVEDEPGLPTSRGAVDHVLSRRGLQQSDDDEEYSYDEYDEEDDEEEWEEGEFEESGEEDSEEEIVDLEAAGTASDTSNEPLFPDEPLATDEPADNRTETKESGARDEAATESIVADTTESVNEAPERLIAEDDGVAESQSPTSSKEERLQESPGLSSDASDTNRTQQNMEPPTSITNVSNDLSMPPVSGQLSAPSTTSITPKFTSSSAPVSGQLSASSGNRNEPLRRSNQERKKAQAESRQLRKHVVVLHAQLETVEAEMKAQREELQRAGERMERDRNRHREEREEMMDEHDEELETQKEHYERLIAEQKERHDEQIEELRERLELVEEKRMQEGGDWTKELEDAIERERESLKKLGAVQDENSNLQSMVAKLETQQSALQNRLDSATQNAQNASNREREVEDKFDAALSLHSRQLSQRQAREAELERTVADLGAALVVARQKRPDPTSQPSATGTENFKEQLLVALEELETVKVQLSLERQRGETLKLELQDMSKERTEEASAAQARQRQHDRQVADLTSTVSRLQVSLRDIQRLEAGVRDIEGTSDTKESVRVVRLLKEAEETKNTVKSLSEQLIRAQNQLESSKTEILALKNRLRTATTRAENAEKALTSSANVPNVYEMDISGATLGPGRLKRRVKGGRGRGGGSSVKSIRSALNMEPGRVGEGTEQVAVTIDAIDKFMVDTGALLRQEPIARAAFFLYLVILHVWAFCLVIFHAHSFENEHGDFGSLNDNGGIGRGPDEHSYRQMEQMGSP